MSEDGEKIEIGAQTLVMLRMQHDIAYEMTQAIYAIGATLELLGKLGPVVRTPLKMCHAEWKKREQRRRSGLFGEVKKEGSNARH